VGPVISAVAGDIEGSTTKDAKEEVSEVEAVNDGSPSKKSTPQKKGRPQDAKEIVPEVAALKSKDGTQKKVKLGSKARRLLKLQKQQGQKGIKLFCVDGCKCCVITNTVLIQVYCYAQGWTRNRTIRPGRKFLKRIYVSAKIWK
jgi:hypothetical protein